MQRDDASLRPPANGPRKVKLRCRRRPSRQNEGGQRRELGIDGVDGPFQIFDAAGIDAVKSIGSRRRQVRTDIEKIRLHRLKLRVQR